MARQLFVVDDTFEIKGRGLILAAGISPEGEERFRVGDLIRLQRPDGSAAVVRIDGLEILSPNLRNIFPILLTSVSKNDVPIGTEVWSVDSDAKPHENPGC